MIDRTQRLRPGCTESGEILDRDNKLSRSISFFVDT